VDEQLAAVVAEGVPADLASWSNDDLRARRAEDEGLEAVVSYARRVLQGRLDIVRAELERRRDHGGAGAEELLARLPEVLAGDHTATSPAAARAMGVTVPDAADALVASIDRDLGEATLHGLAQRDEGDIAELVGRLEAHEADLSRVRRVLFDRIDAMRAELAARYKDGRAAVADLLR
jgi:hypothetical protein